MEAQAEEEAAPVTTTGKKEQKENARHRSVSRIKAPPPKAILKRKKVQSYWSWAGPAAAVAAAVLVALLAVLGYYQYYLPASASN